MQLARTVGGKSGEKQKKASVAAKIHEGPFMPQRKQWVAATKRVAILIRDLDRIVFSQGVRQ